MANIPVILVRRNFLGHTVNLNVKLGLTKIFEQSFVKSRNIYLLFIWSDIFRSNKRVADVLLSGKISDYRSLFSIISLEPVTHWLYLYLTYVFSKLQHYTTL